MKEGVKERRGNVLERSALMRTKVCKAWMIVRIKKTTVLALRNVIPVLSVGSDEVLSTPTIPKIIATTRARRNRRRFRAKWRILPMVEVGWVTPLSHNSSLSRTRVYAEYISPKKPTEKRISVAMKTPSSSPTLVTPMDIARRVNAATRTGESLEVASSKTGHQTY